MPRVTGTIERAVVGGENVRAFIPRPLPPAKPPLALDDETRRLLGDAEIALAHLDLTAEIVPSVDWFIYGFDRKEAVTSSQIEGTQATLIDVLEYEAHADPEPLGGEDAREVLNYLRALTFARRELRRKSGLPISMRLLNGAHARLMRGVRGKNKQPGEIRRTQNWIGGTRPGNAVHVPPPPNRLRETLSDFEKYIHADDALPPIVRTGLAHVQFETIHPYLDGNGRIGRLLVTLLIEHWGLLSKPLLYLSVYFKRHRAEYYHRLSAVRTDGDWEGWTKFFLEGVVTIAREASDSATELVALVSRDRARMLDTPSASVYSARLFERLPSRPIITVARVMTLLDTTRPTATKAIAALVDAGILRETSGRKRDRIFAYKAYLDRLRAGTDL
ncbi:Fic family protein [bacterium]|nr:Fic family protein [bacterium]